jgi:hypothetical protein
MEGLARREARHHFGDLRGTLRGPLRLMDAVEHRVAVCGVEPVEEGARIGLCIEGRRKVRIRGRPSLGRVRRVPTPVAFARVTCAKPPGFIRPSAIRRSTRSRFIWDQALRSLRGVNLTL